MKRLNTVRSGWRATISTMVGRIRSIHGVSQMPPLAKIRCMPTQRWTAFSIGIVTCRTPSIGPVQVEDGPAGFTALGPRAGTGRRLEV
jgi:hypothetical protein